jgi:hypothetical protein
VLAEFGFVASRALALDFAQSPEFTLSSFKVQMKPMFVCCAMLVLRVAFFSSQMRSFALSVQPITIFGLTGVYHRFLG